MGRRPRALTPESSACHRFGAELRRWRIARGMTQRALAGLVWHSHGLVSKVEKGKRWPSCIWLRGVTRPWERVACLPDCGLRSSRSGWHRIGAVWGLPGDWETLVALVANLPRVS
jgi:Helix-turn-helix domain